MFSTIFLSLSLSLCLSFSPFSTTIGNSCFSLPLIYRAQPSDRAFLHSWTGVRSPDRRVKRSLPPYTLGHGTTVFPIAEHLSEGCESALSRAVVLQRRRWMAGVMNHRHAVFRMIFKLHVTLVRFICSSELLLRTKFLFADSLSIFPFSRWVRSRYESFRI